VALGAAMELRIFNHRSRVIVVNRDAHSPSRLSDAPKAQAAPMDYDVRTCCTSSDWPLHEC
jgi:hypothetical protein